MKKLLGGLMAATLLTSPALAHEVDDDVKRDVKITHDFEGFDRIEVEGVYLLDIRKGDSFSVRTEAREKEARWMEIVQEGDTLVLGRKDDDDYDSDKNWGKNDKGILAIITMPRLESVEVAGIATGHIEAFDGGDITVEVAGIADLALSGDCGSLDLDFAGMGDIQAGDLKCSDVEAALGGMGALTVYASESVDAEIGGMGNIDVYGDPKDIRTDKSMFSNIDIK